MMPDEIYHLKIPDTTTITKWLLEYNHLEHPQSYDPRFNRDETILAQAAEQMRMACYMSLLATHLYRTEQ